MHTDKQISLIQHFYIKSDKIEIFISQINEKKTDKLLRILNENRNKLFLMNFLFVKNLKTNISISYNFKNIV